MPKIVAMPTPRRHCLVIAFNRGEDAGFKLELLDADEGDSIAVLRDLVFHELVTNMRLLECAPETVAKAIDAMLGGQHSMLVGVDLSEAQIQAFKRRT
jgi:hypothetical protein